jgi:hypothetical protein
MYENNMHAYRESNLDVEIRNSLPEPLGQDLKCLSRQYLNVIKIAS